MKSIRPSCLTILEVRLSAILSSSFTRNSKPYYLVWRSLRMIRNEYFSTQGNSNCRLRQAKRFMGILFLRIALRQMRLPIINRLRLTSPTLLGRFQLSSCLLNFSQLSLLDSLLQHKRKLVTFKKLLRHKDSL